MARDQLFHSRIPGNGFFDEDPSPAQEGVVGGESPEAGQPAADEGRGAPALPTFSSFSFAEESQGAPEQVGTVSGVIPAPEPATTTKQEQESSAGEVQPRPPGRQPGQEQDSRSDGAEDPSTGSFPGQAATEPSLKADGNVEAGAAAGPGAKAGVASMASMRRAVARDAVVVQGPEAARASSLQARLEAAEVVFSVENVAVHPSASASQRIRGRLRLVKQGPSVYLSWLPYSSAERPNGLDPQAKGQQYAIRAVSLSEIRSLRRQTPTLGWQYVIIVLNTGLAFPPLYFYDGGVRAFIAAVKQHATLIKSQDDPNVYLVNDTEDPLMLQRNAGLNWEGAFASIQAGLQKSSAAGLPGSEGDKGWGSTLGARDGASPSTSGSADVPMQVLQGFAGLTRFARIALGVSAGQKAGERVLGGPDAAERMPVRSVPRDSQKVPGMPLEAAADEVTAPSELGQFELVDPLEEVLAATKAPQEDGGPPLTHEEWVACLDEDGRVSDKDAVCGQIFRRGIEPELRREVWKFLLGYYPFDSTYAERRQLDDDKREEYQIYKRQWQTVTEVQARRFAKYRERVSRIEKDVVRTDRKLPQFLDDDSASFEVLRSILLTYSFYNFDLGYCQGMSDLLSPFLVIMEDESETFWCFAQFMETMGRNFNRDQTGMHSQLLALSKLMRLLDEPLYQYLESIDAANHFCCFRWLLILFKREFDFQDVLKLWERLWTCPMTKNFHLYICCAILKRYRRKIFDEQMQFDALLRFINELSCRIDLDDALHYAEALCLWAGKRGEACIPQPVEEEMVLIEGPETGDH